MASSRRHASLKPHLNQVRSWVEMGATDIWIAHQLGSTPASIAAFRQKNGLLRTGGAERPEPVEARAARPPAEATKPRARTRSRARADDAPAAAEPEPPTSAVELPAPAVEPDEGPAPAGSDETAQDDAAGDRPRRRRGRRGGRGRGRGTDGDTPLELEAVFDHGDEGYGLWLDAAVRDAGVYRAHWMGHREVTVRVTPDEIVIRRADSGSDAADGD